MPIVLFKIAPATVSEIADSTLSQAQFYRIAEATPSASAA